MEKYLVKHDRKIKGFVYKKSDGWYFVFGKPSQASYLEIGCEDLRDGINKINKPMFS